MDLYGLTRAVPFRFDRGLAFGLVTLDRLVGGATDAGRGLADATASLGRSSRGSVEATLRLPTRPSFWSGRLPLGAFDREPQGVSGEVA